MKFRITRTIVFLILILIVFNKNIYATENHNINFQSITIDDGLSQSLVEYIYQDSYGYIWMATNDGLNRYNGNEIKVYKNIKKNENSISNNMISSIVEDSSGNFWIGTDGGLNKMNLATGNIKRYLVSDKDKKHSNTVVDELLIGTYRLNKEEIDIVNVVEDTALAMVELAEVRWIELIVDPEIELR